VLNRLSTRDKLLRVGIPIRSILCVLCNLGEENSGNLFFTCEVPRSLWNRCGGWLGVQFVHHYSVKEHFLRFCAFGMGKSGTGVWRVLWLTIVWSIWKLRNNIAFKNMVCDIVEVFFTIQTKTWAVIRVKFKNSFFSYSNWVIAPLECIKMLKG